MISKQDVLRLIHRPDGDRPILSVFLDTSVNAVNQRTHSVFLAKAMSRHQELDSDRTAHHREALGAAFDRVLLWLDEQFDEANKGAAIYVEIGGEWLEAIQFPVAVRNRVAIDARPVIGPVAEIIETGHHHGIVVVDRVHLRLIHMYLGAALAEHEVHTDPYPAPHDERSGGEAAKDRQKRKAEEVRHFFKEFALEVAEFVRRYRPDDLVLLGTHENVRHFLEFLPHRLRDMVAHTDHAPVGVGTPAITERLAPFFAEQVEKEEAAAANLLHDRVGHDHLAVAGFRATLEQLQEGKVETLVIARHLERTGAHCRQCGFYLVHWDGACPYCRGELQSNVDIVEAMIRIAEEQEVELEFVVPESLTDLEGVGALLKF